MLTHEIADIGRVVVLELVVGVIEANWSRPKNGTELEIVRTGDTVYARLHGSESYTPISAFDPRSKRDLEDFLEKDSPRVCRVGWSDRSGRIRVDCFLFGARWVLPDLRVCIDQVLLDAIARRAHQPMGLKEAASWLADELLLPPMRDGGPPRAVVLPSREGQSMFVVKGARWSLRIAKLADGRWRGDSLIRPRTTAPVVPALLEAKISFVDIGEENLVSVGSGETQLDKMVQQATGYLAIWREYQGIEWNIIAAEAQEFGSIAYQEAQRMPNGRWKFALATAATDLQVGIAQQEAVGLAASHCLPEYLTSPKVPIRGQEDPASKPLFGGICELLERNCLEISPLHPGQEVSPPKKGFIFRDLRGDLTSFKRRQDARERVESGQCSLPLVAWLNGANVPLQRPQRYKELSAAAKEKFGAGGPNIRQVEALRVALNTPDIALIQGPPGTGKTRTIAALLVRLGEISEEQNRPWERCLLTSFQHDAVENAAAVSTVFGIPAFKVSRKRGAKSVNIALERWRHSTLQAVRARLSHRKARPLKQLLDDMRLRRQAYLDSPGTPAMSVAMLRSICTTLADHLPALLVNEIHEVAQRTSLSIATFDDKSEAKLISAQGLRTSSEAFSDDGPRTAFRVLHLMRGDQQLGAEDTALLEQASRWTGSGDPPFLGQLADLKQRLIDGLQHEELTTNTPLPNEDVIRLLDKVVATLDEKVRTSPDEGLDNVLEEFLRDLETDDRGLEDTLARYSVVLAATCQQSVSERMFGYMDSTDEFETVIIDEAARANPLDLLIPMSRARRRIILVGDHRQLPHMLDAEIERNLEHSIKAETEEALRKSLFERLFDHALRLEQFDGIKRRVTLNAQYRMHPVLGEWVSTAFYDEYGEKFGSPGTAVSYSHPIGGEYDGRQAVWHDIPQRSGKEERTPARSWRRRAEAKWIAAEACRLLKEHPGLSVGVITFYTAQVDCIMEEMRGHGLSEPNEDGKLVVSKAYELASSDSGEPRERLRVGTVDSFQGKEFDVVFLSVTRSNLERCESPLEQRRKFGHLCLVNRLCVAMSRQRLLLIAVGDRAMFESKPAQDAVPALKSFLTLCDRQAAKGSHAR